MNISFLRIYYYDVSVRYELITYQYADKNDEWLLHRKKLISKESLGDINIHIEHFPHPDNVNVSLSAPSGDLGIGGSFSGNHFEGDMSFDPPIYEDPTNLLITVNDRWQGPKCVKIEKAHPNQSYFFDYKEDFLPADTNFYIQYPMNNYVSAIIRGINDPYISEDYIFNIGHILSHYVNRQGVQEFTMGYFFGYEYYLTAWSITLSDKAVSFEKFGAAPTEEDFHFLSDDFKIINSNIYDFRFDITGDFEYRMSTWTKNKTVIDGKDHLLYWQVYAPVDKEQNSILKQFPKAIREEYSYLDEINQLDYKSSVFENFLDDYDYSDFIYQKFKTLQDNGTQYKNYSVYKFD